MKHLFLSVLSIVCLGACSTSLPVPDVSSLKKGDPHKSWARVLHKHVNNRGEVDFKAMAADPDDLNRYVEYISRVSPTKTPREFKSKSHELAYYINSYNALSMYNVIQAEIPESLSGLKKVKFFYFTKVKIGGEMMSLYDYENMVIRALGEERIHFALNCMSAGCPQLPRQPFSGKNIEAELERESKKFFNEDRNVRVDHEKKIVYLSEILDFFPEDFLKKSKSLIAYANRYHRNKLPEDYEVDFIPYDWTINSSNRHAKMASQ